MRRPLSVRKEPKADENMPHFTVVPVQDGSRSNYDGVEGINCVDYRDTGQDGYPGHGDTVSSDGEFRQNSRHEDWKDG